MSAIKQTETVQSSPTIAELRAAFQQAEAHAQWVASKNDFTPEGEQEFREATRAMQNAYNALWYAERKQWGNRCSTPSGYKHLS